jgi:hypothetical protein
MKKMILAHPRQLKGTALLLSTCLAVFAILSPMALANCQPEGNSGTGCEEDPGVCNLIMPNYGDVRTASWECCYDSDGNLTSAINYSCDPSALNGGCCNNLATPQCPPIFCPPN